MILLTCCLLIQQALSAHLPNSTTDWDYGQHYLGSHNCESNQTNYTCIDFIHRPTLQTPLTAAYNGLFHQLELLSSNDPGDWTALNRLLQNITLSLPDFTTTVKQVLTATIHVTNIKCGGISIINLAINPSRPTNTRINLEFNIDGLTLSCAADWNIDASLGFHGNGALTTKSKGSDLSSEVVLKSKDFHQFPPNDSNDAKCTSNIVISDLEFTGGATATILGWFKSTIIKELEETLNPLLCHELKILVGDTLASALINVSKLIDPYLTKSALTRPNVQKRERELVESDVSLLEQDSLVHLSNNFWMSEIFNITRLFLGWNETIKEFGINVLIRQALPPAGHLNLTNLSTVLYDSSTKGTKGSAPVSVNIVLDSLSVVGLDSFDSVDLLRPISTLNYTLLSEFTLKKIHVEVGLLLTMTPTESGGGIVGPSGRVAGADDTVEERIIVTLGVDRLHFNMTTMLAIDGDALGNTTLSSIFNDPAGCLLDHLVVGNITSLDLVLGAITPIQIDGFVSRGLDRLADGLAKTFGLGYYDTLLIALPSMTQHILRPLLNTYIHAYLSNVTCLIPYVPPEGNVVNLLTSKVLITLRNLLDKYLTVKTLNKIINNAGFSNSGQWGGVFRFAGSLLAAGGESVDIPQLGHLHIDAGNITMSGLDTLNNYALLLPIQKHEATDQLEMAAPPDAPLMISMDLLLNLVGGQVNITDHVSLGLNMTTLDITLDTMLELNGHWVSTMTLADVFGYDRLGCFAATIKDIRLVDNHTKIEMEKLCLQVLCYNCTSPDMPDLINRTHDVHAQEQITTDLNSFVARMISKLYSNNVHSKTMSTVNKWSEKCQQSHGGVGSSPSPTSSGPSPGSTPGPSSLPTSGCYTQKAAVVGTASGLIFLATLFGLHRHYLSSSHRQSDHSLHHPLLSTGRRRRLSTSHYVHMIKQDVALVHHPAVSRWIRHGVVLAILINFGLFLSGHLSVGASVDLVAHFAGDKLELNTIYTFSLGSSLSDMWTACAIVLATLIGSFSGVWPYMKLLLMCFVWVTPPRIMATRRRGALMQVLDIMGKWSLIDLYVLVMSMIAFFVQIFSPNELEILPPGFYLFSLWVTPVFGLYAFCLAVTSSLFLSHVQIVAHRDAVASDRQEASIRRGEEEEEEEEEAEQEEEEEGRSGGSLSRAPAKGRGRRRRSSWFDAGTLDLFGVRKNLVAAKEAVWDHVFQLEVVASASSGSSSISGSSSSSSSSSSSLPAPPELRLGFKKRGKFMVCLLPITSLLLLVIGSLLPSFQFEINGVAGIAQDFGRTNASITEYSLFSVTTRLLVQSSASTTMTSYVGIRTIAALYIIFSAVIPFFKHVLLLFLWSAPFTLRTQKKLFFLAEVLSSWSATEVYIIATVVATLEIGDISKQIIGNACDPLNPIFHFLNELNIIGTKDMLCFEVGAKILFGAYVLLAASIVSVVTTQMILTMVEVAIEDREDHVKGEEHDEEIMTGCGHKALAVFAQSCIGCCVLRIEGCLEEKSITPEIFEHLRRRRSSMSHHQSSWGGGSGSDRGGGGGGGSDRGSMRSRGRTGTGNASIASSTTRSSVGGGSIQSMGESIDVSDVSDKGGELPPGWTILMDSETKKAYYWNELTGKMTRLKPVWTRTFSRLNVGGMLGRSSPRGGGRGDRVPPPGVRAGQGTFFTSRGDEGGGGGRASTLSRGKLYRVDEAEDEGEERDGGGSERTLNFT